MQSHSGNLGFLALAGGENTQVFLVMVAGWALSAVAGCAGSQTDGNTSRPGINRVLAPLAGTYRLGDGFTGSSLTIGADGNGTYSEFHDVGGKAQWPVTADVTDGVLVLRILAMVRGEDGAPRDVIRRYLPVRWGERLYLLHDDEGADFCAALHRGLEPRKDRFGLFYLREDDWDKPAPGRPELPESFKVYVLRGSVEAKIVRILDSGAAVIDAGSEDGLHVGMFLIATKTAVQFHGPALSLGFSGPEPVKVVVVQPHEATIEQSDDFRLRHFSLGTSKDWEFVLGGAIVSRLAQEH